MSFYRRDFDTMIGTLTKSIGAVGGKISGDHGLICAIRATSTAFLN